MNRLKQKILFALLLLVSVGVGRAWSADASETWAPEAAPTSSGEVVKNGTNMTITAYGSWQYVNSCLKKTDTAVYPDAATSVTKANLETYLTDKTYFMIHANATGTIKVNGLYGGNATKIVCGLTQWDSSVVFKSDATDNTAWGAPCTIEFQALSNHDYYVFVPNGGDVLFSGFEFYANTGANVTLLKDGITDNGTATMTIDYPFYATETYYPGATAYGVNGYKVTLKATPNSDKLIYTWTIGGTTEYVNGNETFTIDDFSKYASSGDVTIKAGFTSGIHVYTKVDGCGTVTFTHWGTACENGYWSTPYTDFVFTATPADGYTFTGWYNGETNVGTKNPYTASVTTADLTLTAKFTRSDGKSENGTTTYDLSGFAAITNQGNVQSAAYSSTDKALVVTTKESSDNYFSLYSNLSGVSGTGIRISSKGVKYRIIIKTSDNKTFVKYVDATTDYTTTHYLWSDFNLQWTSTAMTSEDVAKITEIGLGGWNEAGVTDQKFYVNGFWIDNIADYDHTIPCYGEEGQSYSYPTYTYTVNSAGAAFNPIYGGDRDEDGNIKLASAGTITLSRSGYEFTSVKIVFASSSTYDFTVAGKTYQGTGEAVICTVNGAPITITNNGDAALSINKIVYAAEATGINESRQDLTTYSSRPYWLYVPASVKGSSTKAPVVFSLHGAGGDYNPTTGGAQNFNDLADANDFIVVYPNGTSHYFPGWGGTANGWAATGAENDDIKYFKEIIDKLESSTEFTVDPDRIYITGFSNGGMMTYAAANAAPDVFAAFASISGFPMNEMHLRHCGARAVPFLHIHGKADDFVKYSLSPIIIDNMVARNGLSYTPTSKVSGSGYDYYAYEATDKQPYYFYAVDGMGHSNSATINGQSNQQIIWNFFKDRKLSDTENSTIEFAPDVTNTNATSHGWVLNSGNTIAEYGESGGYTTDNYNVYHTIQLKAGDHHLNFTATNTDVTKYVVVKLIKLGTLSQFDDVSTTTFSVGSDDILMNNGKEKAYYVGNTSFTFTTTEAAEYQLVIEKGAAADATTISAVSITTTGNDTGKEKEMAASTDHTSYVNYHNRLAAQWNFDECDENRFDETSVSSSYWTTDNSNYGSGDGTKTFTYNQSIGDSNNPTKEDSYKELTYGGSSTKQIPITKGLKFCASAGNIVIKAYYTDGKMTGVNLIVNDNVKMLVPYVENTYSDDNGSDDQVSTTNKDNYTNCVHHWKRDILYVSLVTGTAWGHIVNKRIDASNKSLFNSGGSENIDSHYFDKMNYMGTNSVPCILQFNNTTEFKRIGVNRNLTYSFYPEYISDLGSSYTSPEPRMRIIGSPQGQKIANIGDSYTTYSNAIAMTFGGWMNTSGSSSYKNSGGTSVTDSWTRPDASASASSTAVGGFAVASKNTIAPTSESLMPSDGASTYHPHNEGKYSVSYTANYTPWTLPCRGGYLKFEPTIPGVLNVDILQTGNNDYYIVDEFGVPCSNILIKNNGTALHSSDDQKGYTFTGDDTQYVKYTFDVYPGKTYYMFSKTAGIGLSGFYFEPYVYRGTAELARTDVKLSSLTLEDGVAYTNPTTLSGSEHLASPGSATGYTVTYDNKAVAVTLNRSFKADKWNSICLPFSMNQNSMETVFGKGTRVVLLRDIQDGKNMESGKTTANFIMHENQDIIAGYPYFILPTQDVTSINTNAYIPTEKPTLVTVASEGFNTNVGSGTYSGVEGFTFTGTFSNVTANKGSYYMNTKGSLSRCTKDAGVSLKPYRAYLGSNTPSLAKSLENIFFGDTDDELKETTDVEEISMDDLLFQNGILTQKANVYNLQGQMVLQNATNLQNLPKGAYIVNGKKFIVR